MKSRLDAVVLAANHGVILQRPQLAIWTDDDLLLGAKAVGDLNLVLTGDSGPDRRETGLVIADDENAFNRFLLLCCFVRAEFLLRRFTLDERLQFYCVARQWAGRMTPRHDIDISNTALYWHFTALTAGITAGVIPGFSLVD